MTQPTFKAHQRHILKNIIDFKGIYSDYRSIFKAYKRKQYEQYNANYRPALPLQQRHY